MDYIEAFKNLRTNNKYGRKSPHKAVLMLTIIELYEQNILTDNEIHYDDILKKTFLKVWNQVLPNEKKFQSEAYLPFWYLQSNRFWHIVPVWGEEDVLSLMRNENVKPSEAKLNKSVRYAELDEDLYFLMTVSSGRSSLKRTLLENYFTLTEEQVDLLSESTDNIVDNSEKAVRQYEDMKSQDNYDKRLSHVEEGSRFDERFQKIEEDLQISFILAYYSFMKTHRAERHIIKKLFPSVYELYNHVAFHPILRENIAPSDMFTYENLLFDLKISLMSENDSMELIDKIDVAIGMLRGNYQETEAIDAPQMEEEHLEEDNFPTADVVQQEEKEESFTAPIPDDVLAIENRRGRSWTENEEELITLYFKQGRDAATIAEIVGRTEVAIKMRLTKLGLIEYTYEQENGPATLGQDVTPSAVSLDDFTIENSFVRCCIKDKRGDKVFSAEGKLKRLDEKLYRLNLKRECFTIKDMRYDGSVWMRGDKKIVAYPQSVLYGVIDGETKYENIIEDITDSQAFADCKVKVSGTWYDNNGDIVEEEREPSTVSLLNYSLANAYTFVPKGKLKCIGEEAEESYDFLLAMAVVEFMQFVPQPAIITFDRLACMMIAVAWEILGKEEEARMKEKELRECIEFLITESKEEMSDALTWHSSRKEIFNAIKDYPMADVFEDTVDRLTEKAPYNVLRAWIRDESTEDIVRNSNAPSATCLYGIHPMKRNPYIEVKQGWMRYLRNEHDSLMTYFRQLYLECLA